MYVFNYIFIEISGIILFQFVDLDGNIILLQKLWGFIWNLEMI